MQLIKKKNPSSISFLMWGIFNINIVELVVTKIDKKNPVDNTTKLDKCIKMVHWTRKIMIFNFGYKAPFGFASGHRIDRCTMRITVQAGCNSRLTLPGSRPRPIGLWRITFEILFYYFFNVLFYYNVRAPATSFALTLLLYRSWSLVNPIDQFVATLLHVTRVSTAPF